MGSFKLYCFWGCVQTVHSGESFSRAVLAYVMVYMRLDVFVLAPTASPLHSVFLHARVPQQTEGGAMLGGLRWGRFEFELFSLYFHYVI